MRIFLSYPSEEREIAERINYTLLARHHDVFFDRSDLPAGGEFDATIANSVAESDLFIFLITPESVAKGRYTLSELRIASRQWSHPLGHVLPVLLRPTDSKTIPPYLRAVNILEPHGEVGAEVADAVEELVKLQARPRRWRAVVATAAISALLALGAVVWGLWGRESGARPRPTAAPARDRLLGQPLPPQIGARARAVAGNADGYVVALTSPSVLQLMTDDHQQRGSSVPLHGEPVAIVHTPAQYFVITRLPDAVVVFDRQKLTIVMTIPMVPPESHEEKRASSEVRSVTLTDGVLWAVTAGGDGVPALLKHRVARWQTPAWVGGRYKTGSDLGITSCHRVRTIGGAAWLVGGSRCVRGASLYRIEGAVRVDEYPPADYPTLACANDVAETPTGSLLFVSCAGELHEARLDGARPVSVGTPRALPIERGPQTTSTEVIATEGRDVFIAINTEDSRPGAKPGKVSVIRVDQAGPIEIGRFPHTALVSLAVSPRSVLAVLKNAEGAFEAVALSRHAGS